MGQPKRLTEDQQAVARKASPPRHDRSGEICSQESSSSVGARAQGSVRFAWRTAPDNRGQGIRSRGCSESCMSGRVFSGPEVQPAEVPRVAPAGVPAGRVPAAKVTASGVAAPASVLCLCGGKETDYGQQDRKDARRPIVASLPIFDTTVSFTFPSFI